MKERINLSVLTLTLDNSSMQKSTTIKLQQRECKPELLSATNKLHPVLQRVFSAREIKSFDEIDYSLKAMSPPHLITNLEQAAQILVSHLKNQSHILIFGDYDADGATSTALCVRALILLGHNNIDFLLTNTKNNFNQQSGQ